MGKGTVSVSVRVAAFGAAVIGVAGCGGSSAPTKAAFVASANQVCASTNAAQGRLAVPTARNASAIGGYVSAEAALSQHELVQLRALTPPAGAGGTVGAIFATSQRQADLAAKLGQQLVAGDTTNATTTYQQFNAMTAAVNKGYDGYGMNICGSASAKPTTGG